MSCTEAGHAAVLSLDAADMSGVHNTDFASNGEVHKVCTSSHTPLWPALAASVLRRQSCDAAPY